MFGGIYIYRFGDLIMCLGVFTFFLGGIGIAFGFLLPGNPLLPFWALIALILIGTGGFFKKRSKG
jgi:hypothetical protein